jgi:hypothetical protein
MANLHLAIEIRACSQRPKAMQKKKKERPVHSALAPDNKLRGERRQNCITAGNNYAKDNEDN